MPVLIPAEQEIAQFVHALFRYAEEGTFVSLRAFPQSAQGRPPLLVKGVEVRGDMAGVIKGATWAAERAANSSEAAVFAPPVATFNNPNQARSVDVACGLALSVEMDQGNPEHALRKLEALLGPATVIMASGGEWVDPDTGEMHNKVHLHWRLSEPTLTPADHSLLQEARRLAALFVGGDPTAAPPAHPLRWPGSWNRKAKPRMAMSQGGNPAAEIHLSYALDKLAEAVEAAGLGEVATTPKASGEPQAPLATLADAMAAVPNADVHWEEWNRLGMAMYRASAGSAEGLAVWDEWSAKSAKYMDGECAARWSHFGTSPPSRLGAGTIMFMAKAEGWQRPGVRPPDHTTDEGYWASLEAELAMTPAEWNELEQREAGHTVPTSPELRARSGKNLLWSIVEPWDEADIPSRPWIARGYLMRGAVTVVSGPGSAGKSSLMVGWATALALGCSYGRLKIPRAMRVATYNVEDDEFEQKRRFSATLAQLHLKPVALNGNLAIIGPHDVGTLFHQPRDGRAMLNTPVMERLMTFLDEFQPDVLILDPFVELHTAEENDNTAIRAVMAAFRNIAAERQISIVILHHARKSMGGPSKPGDPDSLRGASAIVGAARVALTLNVMSEDEAKSFNISADRRRDYFRLDGAKSNYAPIGDAEWFERRERLLQNNDGVAVAWPWAPPNLLKEAPIADLNKVLEAIHAGPRDGVLYSMSRRGRANDRWVGHVVSVMLNGTLEQAAEIVAKWKHTGLLYEETYVDREQRKPISGVRVDFTKRPDGTSTGGI